MGKVGVMGPGQMVGALTVLIGFVLVNIRNKDDAAANLAVTEGDTSYDGRAERITTDRIWLL